MKRKLVLALALAMLAMGSFSASAYALFDLQITEMWFGQDGDDITVDWFELTNVGDTPWIQVNDGPLYYDDGNGSPTQSQPMTGISTIQPNQAVIYMIETEGDLSLVTDFKAAWEPVVGKPIKVGRVDEGQSLGAGGDGVTVWLGNPQISGVLLDEADYPNTAGFSGRSWDVGLGTFSVVGNASGAVATTLLGGGTDTVLGSVDDFEPGIGSPGVPEPASAVLVLMGAFIVAMRYRLG